MDQPKFPYKLAELYDAAGDMSKRWRVTFYVWDEGNHILVRKQKWISNKFTTKSQRIKEADRLIKSINNLLASGYHIKANSSPSLPKNQAIISWLEAFQWAQSAKKNTIRYRSTAQIEFILEHLEVFLRKHKLLNLPVQFVTRHHVELFLAFLYERAVGNATKNSYIKFIKVLFNTLVQAEKLSKSPAQSFKLFPEEEATQQAFGPELKKILLDRYQIDCPELVPLVQWIYYSFIRPGELIQLQVKHLQEKTIFIPGHISKNKKAEHVLISPALEGFIQKHGIRQLPEHYFLIGYKGLPGKKAPCKHYFSNRHKAVREALNLPLEYKLYCWKHTGVTDTYRQTRDIDFVSRQCRHSSLDMTKRYLRGLGLLLDYPHQDQLPVLEL